MSRKRPESMQYLIHFGLTQSQQAILESCTPGNAVLHDASGCATDIIALCPTLGVVINPDSMTKNDLKMILDYYNEVGWGISESVVLTKKIDGLRSPKIICLNESGFTSERMSALLAQANSRNKRNAGHHERLALCLTILKRIRKIPGISTKKLAEECEVSEKTILRYIETLRVSGEWLEYDRQSRGWTLHPVCNSFFD